MWWVTALRWFGQELKRVWRPGPFRLLLRCPEECDNLTWDGGGRDSSSGSVLATFYPVPTKASPVLSSENMPVGRAARPTALMEL